MREFDVKRIFGSMGDWAFGRVGARLMREGSIKKGGNPNFEHCFSLVWIGQWDWWPMILQFVDNPFSS